MIKIKMTVQCWQHN